MQDDLTAARLHELDARVRLNGRSAPRCFCGVLRPATVQIIRVLKDIRRAHTKITRVKSVRLKCCCVIA